MFTDLKNQGCAKRAMAMHPASPALLVVVEDNSNAGISVGAWVSRKCGKRNAVYDSARLFEIRKGVVVGNLSVVITN